MTKAKIYTGKHKTTFNGTLVVFVVKNVGNGDLWAILERRETKKGTMLY